MKSAKITSVIQQDSGHNNDYHWTLSDVIMNDIRSKVNALKSYKLCTNLLYDIIFC